MVFPKGKKFPKSGIEKLKKTFKKRKELKLHIGTKKINEKKINYCLNCDKEIIVSVNGCNKDKKFCSSSCASSYNNKIRWSDNEKKQNWIRKINETRKNNNSYHTGSLKAIQTRRQNNNLYSWNTGLTKETDERLKKASEKQSKDRKGVSWVDRFGDETAKDMKRQARQRLTGMIIDGKLELNYGLEWIKIRKEILIRDNYTCCVCNVEKAEKVHHIVPYRIIKKHEKFLLVSVCKKCHLKIEPKNIPTEEITFESYINYYINKGGKLPLETTRRTPITGDDIVRTSDIK